MCPERKSPGRWRKAERVIRVVVLLLSGVAALLSVVYYITIFFRGSGLGPT